MEFDAQSEQADRFVAALQESLLRESVTAWPADNDDDRCMKLAHRDVSEMQNGATVVSAPLTAHNGFTNGAWICIFEKDQNHLRRITRFSEIISPFLADALDCSLRASASPIRRLTAQTREFAKGKMAKIIAAAMLLFVLMMAVPIPHRIDCPCVLQPAAKRFAVAPHDGILEESFAQPGDLVTAGQVIARMDDHELQLELSDLIAERERAIKKRDVNRTLADAAGTRIAELEVEQLNVKIKLLRYRLQNLEIKSAADGIVLQGDLQDAKGAPVRMGDVLMEIAPLDELKLEIDVRERDISYIRSGQKTAIALDGNPLDRIFGQVDRIRPVSEVRDNQNIFVTELTIENQNQMLRPGMRGRAKISEGLRPLGWVLFHHAWEKAYAVWR
jgi:hypothetical protein